MAESFLFSIAEAIIKKLASQPYEDAFRVLGLYDDLRDFKQTLSLVKAVLLNADQNQEHNNELREWLSQIKLVFYDAQIVLDEFECETLRKQVVKAHGSTKDKVNHFFSSSNPLVFRYKMAQQIKDINKRLDKVAADRHKFSLQMIDVDSRVVHKRDMTHSYVNDLEVIGRKHDKEEIIKLLMQNPNEGLSVIPIVGMGGMGKTTLAKFVFNDKKIEDWFPLKMWVCVFHDFDVKKLIIKIINSANDSASLPHPPDLQQNLKMLDVEQLQNQLRSKLIGHKFLLILDDVWEAGHVKWVELRDLLKVGAPGSKILVTTRNHSTASMMGTVPTYDLQSLCQEDSLSLFVKWAFKEGEDEKYPHLLNIGREIVEKCSKVPLAVRTTGSLLFLKFETNEWERVRDSEIWNLPQEEDGILPSLKLSYDLMPSYLRPCFALLSLYPKGHTFFSFEVTPLWGSLGFLSSPENNGKLNDVANRYLSELLSRSFLQDFVNYGTYYSFKIHDLVHDLSQFVAKDECLRVDFSIQSIRENIRHLCFVENDLHENLFAANSVGVRTILFPNNGVGADGEAFLTLVSRSKYLQILDLSDSTFETLPSSIGNLKLLRFLNLRDNKKIKRLPDSICKLQNLQFLYLSRCTELQTLPKGLGNLISLYDLEITTKQAVLPENEIAKLSSLQYLSIDYCLNLESLFSEVEFPILTHFGVIGCKRLKSLPLDRKHFPALEALIVEDCDKLDDFHGDQSFSSRLKTIRFCFSPNLVRLPTWLQGSVNTLLSLTLDKCENLDVLPDWLSMLTCLKSLHIWYCPKLQALPDGIHCITSLECLEIIGCPELCRKYEPHVGECWNKISHIKQIFIDGKRIWQKS